MSNDKIDISPNYSGLFAGMIRNAESYAKRLDQTSAGERDMHTFIALIAAAIHTAGSTADIENLRKVLDLATTNLSIRQTKLDGDEYIEE